MTRLILVAAIVCASSLTAQTGPSATIEVELGVQPTSVTVGEPFASAISVSAPPGMRIEYGEFSSGDTLRSLGPPDIVPTQATASTAVYRLVAWVPGVPLSATVPVRLVEPDGRARIHLVRLRLPTVASVLPADTAGIAPRPAKSFLALPGDRMGLPWWYWAIAIFGALVAAALAVYLLKRRDDSPAQTSILPREWALRQLESLRSTPSTPDEVFTVYGRGSWILRSYLERVDPRLGTDLTSAEVVRELSRMTPGDAGSDALEAALGSADRVKFSRQVPSPEAAIAWLGAVQTWVANYPAREDAELGATRAA